MIDPDIGGMRNRLEIQSRTLTQNTYGEAVPTWSTVATRWGKVEPLTGREAWQAQQVRPDLTHKVTIRHYAGLTPKHRILFGSRVFEIDSVLNLDERNRFMVLTAKEQL